MIELTLPYPPSANRLWRMGRNHMHKSVEYTDWLMVAGLAANKQHPGKLLGRYKITIQVARPDNRKRDLDNLIKPTNDLLKSIGVVEDDSLCEMISMRWVTVGEGVHVRIEPAGVE